MRIVSFVTFLSTLISSVVWTGLPAFSVSADPAPAEPSVYVARDGERIEYLTITDSEKVILSAVCEFEEGLSYKWQILDRDKDDRWIDISGAFMADISVSYSLVGSLANERGDAYIRCYMFGSKEYVTAPLCVHISYGVDNTEANSLYPGVMQGVMQGVESIARMQSERSSEGTEELPTHSIVINYLFDNNAIAFEPYGATVAHGSNFSETVTSPTVVGYSPFRRVGEDYVDATVVELNYDNIQSDIVINIIYEPALVEFSVHHHLQNLFDDDYSLSYDYITKSHALTGSTVPEGLAFTQEQLPGFKSLSYERLTVAADGSTVVEIRYDRNYYLVDFDMNGGYGTDPVYTRFGSTVGANTPIRHGYVFDGWELVSFGGHTPTSEQQSKYALAEGSTIIVPDANLRYRARWITTQTTYTMVFWQENADDNGYTYWGYLDGLGAMSGSTVNGQDLISQVEGIDDEQYFTFNSEKTEKGVLVEGDGSTVVNVYYTRNYYKLTVKATGTCTIPVGHTHTDGCYDLVCELGHTHTDDCVPSLFCPIPEHVEHTDRCLACGKNEHKHGTADCDCDIEEHTHTKSCWGSVAGNAQNNKPTGAPTSPVDGQVFRRTSYSTRYIYIKGTWYTYSGRASNGAIVDPTCNYSSEHTHGTNCACDIEAHEHGDTCYGDVLHTHNEYCYSYSCGEIAHVHSERCIRLKCGITENHTHNTTCNNKNSTNTVKTVYKKYGQSMEDLWPIADDNGVLYDSGERWSPSGSSYYDQVLVYISKMPPDDFTLTLNRANYSTYVMEYYLQALPGMDLTGSETVTHDGNTYVLFNTIKANYNYVTKAEDFFDIKGFYQYESSPAFSGNQISISSSNKTVKFYYNRITDHYLEFNNNGIMLDDRREYGIMYGASLKDYNFTPDYPSNLEPNAYSFAGWYTSPGCFDGTEVDWDTLTMTEGDLLLYAKWAPVKHSVKVYLDSSLSEQIGQEQLVDHNAFATAPTGHIENGNYIFQGWFYTEIVNGEKVEKAFVFSGIPVDQDMNIYAKWSSHVSVEYKINYVLHLTGEPIADPTIGSAIAGNNKTFDAKAGDLLYEGYRTGYYPLTNSHTITMSVDGTHEFTFRYVYVESMPYTVRYVNAKTGEALLPDKKVEDNTYSVVTETFVRIDKMMPDAYQKRLVLSANDTDGDGVYDDNVITFYYNSDEEHAYYKVVHYIQNIGADTYREYRSVEAVGNIGEAYTIDALTLTGFEFASNLTTVNGTVASVDGTQVECTLGPEGMLVELYYNRASFGYTVKYTDGDTGLAVSPDKQGSALFGSQVLEYALNMSASGYTLSSEDLKILNISANTEHNVIEFIYLESVVSVKYQVIGLPGSGSLSRTSENVKAISGSLSGSVPTASSGYAFVGWFTDADCTIEVDPSFVEQSTMKLTPKKSDGDIWKENAIYYAKFIPKLTKLTVINSGWNITDTDQAFLYRLTGVEGTETELVDLTFTINGNGATTIAALPVGDYTVTLISDWAWRYECTEGEKSLSLSVDPHYNVVEFTNTRSEDKWLDGNASADNLFS